MKSYIPKNIDELFNCLAEMTPNSKIVAGSTDLGIRLQKGGLSPDALLYMGSIKETRDIVEYDKYVEIGAYVTHTELEKSPIICKYFTAISDAAKDVGSLQIRNNGTIGGNIANASPAGDLLPVLFMLDATVVVATKNKELKDIKISEFILGPGKTVLEVGEAIVKFRINKIDDFISAFIKLGSRKKLTISRIGCTIGITFKESTIDDIKIYIGAISLTPVQLKKAEEYLKNENIMELFNIQIKKDISNFMSSLIYEITPEKFDRDQEKIKEFINSAPTPKSIFDSRSMHLMQDKGKHPHSDKTIYADANKLDLSKPLASNASSKEFREYGFAALLADDKTMQHSLDSLLASNINRGLQQNTEKMFQEQESMRLAEEQSRASGISRS